MLTFQKQVKVCGQDANTRVNGVINQFKVKHHLLVMKYNSAQSTMIVLRCMNTEDDDDFLPLFKADVTMKHLKKPYQLGDGK